MLLGVAAALLGIAAIRLLRYITKNRALRRFPSTARWPAQPSSPQTCCADLRPARTIKANGESKTIMATNQKKSTTNKKTAPAKKDGSRQAGGKGAARSCRRSRASSPHGCSGLLAALIILTFFIEDTGFFGAKVRPMLRGLFGGGVFVLPLLPAHHRRVLEARPYQQIQRVEVCALHCELDIRLHPHSNADRRRRPARLLAGGGQPLVVLSERVLRKTASRSSAQARSAAR